MLLSIFKCSRSAGNNSLEAPATIEKGKPVEETKLKPEDES